MLNRVYGKFVYRSIGTICPSTLLHSHESIWNHGPRVALGHSDSHLKSDGCHWYNQVGTRNLLAWYCVSGLLGISICELFRFLITVLASPAADDCFTGVTGSGEIILLGPSQMYFANLFSQEKVPRAAQSLMLWVQVNEGVGSNHLE